MTQRNVLATVAPGHGITDLAAENARWEQRTPQEILAYVLAHAANPIVSTNFRPRAAVLLHMVTQIKPDIPVIWVDTGYNTAATYAYVETLTRRLGLNLQVYAPRVTAARRAATLGGVPDIDDPQHPAFTEEVKLEPFERALREWQPDVWLTGIRREQTEYRRRLGVFSPGAQHTLRVAPLLSWTEVDLEGYLYEHGLPDNEDYTDPTKVIGNRECGLQLLAERDRGAGI